MTHVDPENIPLPQIPFTSNLPQASLSSKSNFLLLLHMPQLFTAAKASLLTALVLT
jgi:hypothetical protein